MRNSNRIPLLWITLNLLAASENGETLLSDPLYDEEASSSSSSLEGATAEARASQGCHFPEAFRGSWFQSGVHHSITITRSAISIKGRCLEKDGEKYLVYNERNSCYRCLVFNEKHLNVLQYKETFCMPEKRSLRNICSTITGDAYLFAMFRLEAVPIDCPFKGQFSVSYNRGQGECEYPLSTLDSCTKSSRLVFNYQACPDVRNSESATEELTCLANWKEGSSRYFLGLIQYQHHASYEERFRCFVYERTKHARGDGGVSFRHSNPDHNSHSTNKFRSHSLHNSTSSSSSGTSSSSSEQIYRVAQSGDATCNGLNGFEGAKTMALKRVPPAKACQFPSWIQAHSPHWHTLDQGSTYTFLSGNLRISNFSELAGTGPNSLVMNAICYQLLETTDVDRTLLVLHATSECKNGYICTAFYQRDNNIMELQFGSMSRRAAEACHLSHFDPSLQPYVTLVSSTPERINCPNVGHYQVTGLAADERKVTKSCVSEEGDNDHDNNNNRGERVGGNSVSVGCSSSDSIQIKAQLRCDQTDFFAEYNCHGWWSDKNGISYVVTTRSSSQQSLRPQRHCFAFRDLSWTGDQDVSPFHFEKQRIESPEDSTTVDDDGQQDPSSSHNNNNNNGKLFEFSSFADSCRRNVVVGQEGDFAFNLTRIGQCSDINSAPGQYNQHHSLGYLLHLLLTTGITTVLLFANS